MTKSEKEKHITEMDTFIPQDESNITNGGTNFGSKNISMSSNNKLGSFKLKDVTESTPLIYSNNNVEYKITKGLDAEAASNLSGEFDPFKARVLDHPVSASGTLIHLLKSCLGTGILSMPFAFKNAGLLVGIIGTIIESLICTHCAYILVVCAHELYRKSGKTQLSFAGVAEESCRRGPPWARWFAPHLKKLVDIGIFVTYFGTCSAYTVIVGQNFQKVLTYYVGYQYDIRVFLGFLLIPLILLCYIPNLKYLTPVSMISNVFMGLGLLITCYYLVIDLPTITQDKLTADIGSFPTFFSITIFALEAIGVVMPLENHMKKPRKFVGLCGVLNQGMSFVTIIYIMVGFLGYLRFGSNTADNITVSLPDNEILAQSIQILIALAVFGTFGLQFFICLEIVWSRLEQRYEKHPLLANYILRTVMVIVAIAIAIAVPKISPFISLIGSFCFSILGLIVPVIIEVLTFWSKGFGKYNWKVFKNVIVVVTGILALIFGTKSSIQEIIGIYTVKEEVPSLNATLVANLTQSVIETTTQLFTTVP